MVTKEILQAIMPQSKADLAEYASYINLYRYDFGLTTKLRMAHFIAQTAHESAEYNRTEENLNYSASRLLAVFPKYFNAVRARQYAGKPFAIASRIYAGRMGNRDEATQDGWRYRGRGLIQLTGRSNYEAFSRAIGYDVAAEPDLVARPEYAVLSAMWFWKSRGLSALADKDDLSALTRKVNGGLNGLSQRRLYLQRAKAKLK